MAEPQNRKTTVGDWVWTVLFGIAAGVIVFLVGQWAGATTGVAARVGVVAGGAAILTPILHGIRTGKW